MGEQRLISARYHDMQPVFDDDPTLRPRNLKIQSVNTEELDPQLHEKLQILLKKKEEAVQLEDYDAAMELKDISDKLKLIGADLKMLEQRKQDAIGGEDFETAKSCKA